ncbi:PAP2 superfamily-domain-containing protein [Lasiosphaeris hirsuta]|uniref:PAP2 superfamily-domain-containing protein n=1 Tax=Lasiosphaeris hirsuta TaxID=260670 RepID=A0AA40BAD3_9PEZI|nr:PAP2 superfamily-domain-containing protein [Lasiosphaeris hirsuta]
MPDESIVPLIPSINTPSVSPTPTFLKHQAMDSPRLGGRKKGKAWVLILSYVFDWVVLIAAAGIGYVLGDVTPNKRPFSLTDLDISFPFTVHETVPLWLLITISVLAPIVIVAIISLVFVPGATAPRNTPKALIWKRKLWELHTGWLGLALSIVAAWLITNGMKNLFGKPRPDLLSRCQPDLANLSKYIVGGFTNVSSNSQLVSADICQNPDKYTLDDGFRSYPSGHSSSSAAGLIYLSLFIASKFSITLPFFAPAGFNDAAFSAFPSRTRAGVLTPAPNSFELQARGNTDQSPSPVDPTMQKQLAQHAQTVAAVRRQAAAPPLYLLLIAILPFFASVFIASSRWFDFRHHGFDILFGFLIGTICAFFSFRYYHLPISQGAGWAWGPRSREKAFWAGIGSFSYATDRVPYTYRAGDEEEGLDAIDEYGRGTGLQSSITPGSTRKAQVPEDHVQDTAYMGGNGT